MNTYTSKTEALKLALEALEWFTAAEQGDEPPITKTITAIREALAEHIPDATKMIPQTPEQISNFIGSNYSWREHVISDVEPHSDDLYCLTAHDLLSAFSWWAEQPAQQQEPVAWMFQHEETGRTMCVDAQQVEWGFEKGNPRMKKKLHPSTHPHQQASR